MKTELWKEDAANHSAVTSILEERPERPKETEAEKMIEALRRIRIRTMLIQSLCKSLDVDEQRC